jgi:hypothetical protein
LEAEGRAGSRRLRNPAVGLPGRDAYRNLWRIFVGSLLLVVGAQVAAIVTSNVLQGWWPAYDTNAYWLAARHVVDGSPLYTQALIWTAGAYKYPPLFAQLVVPIAFMPEIVVDWAWRICGVMCLRYLSGSWALALIGALQWPLFAELGFGNVTLQLGAACMFALRDRRGAYLLPWFAGMKFGPGLLIPYLWFTRPEWRRSLAAGCAIFAAACLVSFAVAPGLWFDYLGTFGWESASEMRALFVYAIVPQSGGLDLAVRLAIGAALMVAAIRWRKDWLAFAVAVATMPIFSLTRLGILIGLWPLWLRTRAETWLARGGRTRAWLAELLVRLGMISPESASAARSADIAGPSPRSATARGAGTAT